MGPEPGGHRDAEAGAEAFIDAEDIAEVAVAALTEEGQEQRAQGVAEERTSPVTPLTSAATSVR
ncbi:hypothetical protein ACWD0J_14065 [Streptomyces sp. NPDC003011]